MRITRIGWTVIAAAALLVTTGCTSQPDGNALACEGWSTASNAWATAEASDSTSSATLASLRSELRSAFQKTSRVADGDVKSAMTSAIAALPKNALHIVEPGSTYRSAYETASNRVQKACIAAGQSIAVKPAPTLR
jgi:hypothetical protein